MKQLSDLKRYAPSTDMHGQAYMHNDNEKGEYLFLPAVEAIMPKWISVDERLPDEDVSVFVITELGYKFSDSVHSKTFDYENTIESIAAATGSIKEDHITHWLDNVPPAPEAAQ